MAKWKAVRVRQELVEEVEKEVEKSDYKGLSQFVSDAIQHRLQTLAKQRVSEYLERDKIIEPLQFKAQLLYTPKHIWAQMTPQGNVELGITDYFQTQLKEIVNIRTDMIGEKVYRDKPFGVAESWWFTFDLYSPLNGKIISINQEIIENPFMLNATPSLWIVKVQPEDEAVSSWMNDLLSLQKYQKLVAEHRAQLEGPLQ
jgi:glycine cleavage system H protein